MNRRVVFLIFISVTLSVATISYSNPHTLASAQQDHVPSWIKITAQLWIEDQLSTDEFIKSLEWLIENRFIQISSVNAAEQTSINDIWNSINSIQNQLDDLKFLNPGSSGGGCTIFGTTVTCADGTSSNVQGPQGLQGNQGSAASGSSGGGCTIFGTTVTCADGTSSNVQGPQGLQGNQGSAGEVDIPELIAALEGQSSGSGGTSSSGGGCTISGTVVICSDGTNSNVQGPAGPKGDAGLQGSAGPKGDAGLQGSAGPKGDAGSGDSLKVTVRTSTTTVKANSFGSTQADCKSGEILVGGGIKNGDSGIQGTVVSSEPTGSYSAPSGWESSIVAPLKSSIKLTAYAVCATT